MLRKYNENEITDYTVNSPVSLKKGKLLRYFLQYVSSCKLLLLLLTMYLGHQACQHRNFPP